MSNTSTVYGLSRASGSYFKLNTEFESKIIATFKSNVFDSLNWKQGKEPIETKETPLHTLNKIEAEWEFQ